MNFKKPHRILIIGNSGSGKSWLAGSLSNLLELTHFSLDELRWEKGGFYKQRDDHQVNEDLDEIAKRTNFVIEGVYGDLATYLSDRISHLIWLDIDSEKCVESVRSRGFDHIPWMNTESAINDYLEHIRSYGKGFGSMSRSCHKELFDSFNGEKITLSSRDAVNEFVVVVGANS